MTQAATTQSLTTTTLMASQANLALRWQMPRWATADSTSSLSNSFAQMLANRSRVAESSASAESSRAGRSAADPSGSSTRLADSASSSDRSSATRQASRQSRSSDQNRDLASRRGESREPAELSDPSSESPPISGETQAVQTDQAQASQQTEASSPDSADPAQTSEAQAPSGQKKPLEEASNDAAAGDSSTQEQAAQTGPSPQQNPLLADDSSLAQQAVMMRELMLSLATGTAQEQAVAGSIAVATQESPSGTVGTSTPKPSSDPTMLMATQLKVRQAEGESDALGSSPDQTSFGNSDRPSSGSMAGSQALEISQPSAISSAKAETKADFAQKLSEHRPVEAVLQAMGEKKSGSSSGTSSATATASASSGTPAQESGDDANIAQVARGLQNAFKQGGGNVTLRLSPAELGSIKVQLAVQDGVVHAKFTAQSQAAGDLLTHQMDQLRQSLQKQGLQVDRLEVQMPATASGSTSNLAERSSSSDAQSQTAWADEGRSRGQMQDSHQQQSPPHRQGSESADAKSSSATFGDLLNATA